MEPPDISKVPDTALQAMFDRNTQARAAQGYRRNPDTCRTCAKLQYDTKQVQGTRQWDQYETRLVRTNPHCGLGGFPVVVSSVCNQFEPK